MNKQYNQEVKIISTIIARKSAHEAEVFPIDRQFLLPYLHKILGLDKNEFLLYNLEQMPTTYVVKLLLSLPELWEEFSADDLLNLCHKFRNVLSFFGVILFFHRYVEVNIIELVLKSKIENKYKTEIKMYIKSQYLNFFKSDMDWFYFEEGVYGDQSDWLYVKQRLLIDRRVLPSFENERVFELYIANVIENESEI